MAWELEYLDLILSPLAFALMLAYNVHLYIRFTKSPLSTVMGVNHRARRAWVRGIMKDNDKKNILAVQTLRNSIMGSTLLATTAILLSSAVAAFLASSYTIKQQVESSVLGAQNSISLAAKYMCLLACFLAAFLCYVQAVRYTNHVNFIINVPVQGTITPDYVADILEKGANFHTIGTRAFYVTIPLLMWIFGPIPFIVTTVLLIPVLSVLDSAHNADVENMSKGQLSKSQNGCMESELNGRALSRAESFDEEKGTHPVCGIC